MYSGEELDAYFENLEFIRYQEMTRGSEEIIRRDIKEASRKGYAVTAEEYLAGVFSFSFPIEDRTGRKYAFTLITLTRNRGVVFNDEVISRVKAKIEHIRESDL
jgi:DNA-binding IclR family transcriptional regulator